MTLFYSITDVLLTIAIAFVLAVAMKFRSRDKGFPRMIPVGLGIMLPASAFIALLDIWTEGVERLMDGWMTEQEWEAAVSGVSMLSGVSSYYSSPTDALWVAIYLLQATGFAIALVGLILFLKFRSRAVQPHFPTSSPR